MKHINYVFILYIFIYLVIKDGAGNSGPYKATLLSVEICNGTSNDENAPVVIVLEIYNTTTKINQLRGNVTINIDHRVKGARIKNFIWSNNHWKVVRVVNTVACNGVLFPLAAMLFGIKYNRKSCVITKGVYSFTEVDNDKAQHTWIKNQEYGKHRWSVEAFTNNGTAVCVNAVSIVKPLIRLEPVNK